MQPAIYTQADDDATREQLSRDTGLDCSNDIDSARQEFKAETDVKTILNRFGVAGLQPKQPVYGEVDYGMDLQEAYDSVNASKRAWQHLSPTMRAKYPSYLAMLDGMTGDDQFAKDLALDLHPAQIPPAPPTGGNP